MAASVIYAAMLLLCVVCTLAQQPSMIAIQALMAS